MYDACLVGLKEAASCANAFALKLYCGDYANPDITADVAFLHTRLLEWKRPTRYTAASDHQIMWWPHEEARYDGDKGGHTILKNVFGNKKNEKIISPCDSRFRG